MRRAVPKKNRCPFAIEQPRGGGGHLLEQRRRFLCLIPMSHNLQDRLHAVDSSPALGVLGRQPAAQGQGRGQRVEQLQWRRIGAFAGAGRYEHAGVDGVCRERRRQPPRRRDRRQTIERIGQQIGGKLLPGAVLRERSPCAGLALGQCHEVSGQELSRCAQRRRAIGSLARLVGHQRQERRRRRGEIHPLETGRSIGRHWERFLNPPPSGSANRPGQECDTES
jgi:hypothetical protein